MAIPREVIDQVRAGVDISVIVGRHVELRHKGTSLMGLCPFHKEKTPSFSVTPARGIFHCFGCGEGGDVFAFVQKVQGVTFIEALKELAKEAGVEIEERRLTPEERARLKQAGSLRDVCDAAAVWFEENLLVRPCGQAGREYLRGRGLTTETIKAFRIGFVPEGWSGLLDHLHQKGFDTRQVVASGLARPSKRQTGGSAYDLFRDRVMFPIHDPQGRIVSFGGRLLQGDGPKYVNGPETDIYHKSRVLYGLSQARSAIQRERRVLLVEGYFDVVTLHQAGFEAAVATCGTALTRDHLRLLGRFTRRVYTLFDADEAGIRAAIRSMPLLAEAEMDAVRLNLPDGKDPDEFVQKHGAEAFEAALKTAEPLMETVIQHECRANGDTAAGKAESVKALAPLIGRFTEVMRAVYIRRVAEVLHLPEDVVARQVRAPSSPRAHGEDSDGPNSTDPLRPSAPIPALIRDLVWLLIHHRDQVAPHLETLDPELVSERLDTRVIVGRLLIGEPVVKVVADCADPELRSLLSELSSREGLFPEDSVSTATKQIAARLFLNEVNRHLARVIRDLSTCRPDLDRTRYFKLLGERGDLQRRRNEFMAVLSRQSDGFTTSSTT